MARNRKGRQKVQMVKMDNDSNLQVTFSKRRQGLFKKASELCTLCGVEMGVIVFSPGRKVFSFGNPNIRSVINRFKNHNSNPFLLIENGRGTTIQGLNNLLTQELAKFEMEKGRQKDLDKIRNQREETERWWEKPLNQLDLKQKNCLISVLEDLKMELRSQRSQQLQAVGLQNSYGGSYNNIVGGGNVNLFDQTRMLDVNAFNYNPNMIIPNHGPVFGYNNNNNVFEVFGPRYNMNWSEDNQGHY